MTSEKISNRYILVFGFAVFSLAPSFDTVLKYFGVAGVVAYFVLGTSILFAAERYILPVLQRYVSEWNANFLAIATLILLVTATVITYPLINTSTLGSGSDADDALVIAAGELVSGNYPYRLTTYLGNLISPMPGTVLLSIPFVLFGAVHLQNIFWLVVFFLVFRHFEKSSVSALGLVWAMLAFSPTLLQNLLTGSDYASNSIYILAMMWIMIRTIPDPESAEWKRIVPAIILGIGLSSRSTFMLIMPLFLSVLVQTSNWKAAVRYLSISAISFIAVTLPFWIYDPAGFAPLTVQSEKLEFIAEVMPFAGILIPGSAGLLAIVLSFQNMKNDTPRFFVNCAFVQIYVLFLTSLFYSIKLGYVDFFLQQSGYGMFALFFGATAFWMYLNRKPKTVRQQA